MGEKKHCLFFFLKAFLFFYMVMNDDGTVYVQVHVDLNDKNVPGA